MMDGVAHVKNIKPAARRFPKISEFRALGLFLEAQQLEVKPGLHVKKLNIAAL
jgi:hypothetical protein